MMRSDYDSPEPSLSSAPTPVAGRCELCHAGVLLLRYPDGGGVRVDPLPRMTIADDRGQAHAGYRLHSETCPHTRGLMPTFRPPQPPSP